MSEPVGYRRFTPGTPADPRGEVPLDDSFKALSENGATLLLNVWAGRLRRREYSSIDLRLANGQTVTLTRKKEAAK